MGKGVYPVEQTKVKPRFICGGIGLVLSVPLSIMFDNRSDYIMSLYCSAREIHERYFTELEAWSKRKDVKFLETVDKGDPGWKGNVGVVTTLIPKIENELTDSVVLVCGPPIMYKFVLMSLKEQEVSKDRVYLNLERKMKCGVGKCGHCQINNYYVCMMVPYE
jgi:NAD(P)H-flavin reductase